MPAHARMRRFAVAIPAVLSTALAVSVFTAAPADARTRREQKIHHAVEVARNQKGDPYVYGAEGPSSFDCSGLTQFAYAKAGLYLPRTAADQYSYVRHVNKQNMHRGDLMFFHDGGGVYHVGIYLGHHDGSRWVFHSSEPGRPVQRDPVWTTSWWGGTLRHR